MGQFKVFLDSDVIISSLLSQTGASFEILTNPDVSKVISETIQIEVSEVAKRLNISIPNKSTFLKIEVIKLKLSKTRIVRYYLPYVLDQEDSHVVAGAAKGNTRYLLTHNLKHYHREKIQRDFGIILMKPGIFLQYLRSFK